MSKKFVCGIISLLLVGVIVSGCGDLFSDVSVVRDGTMNMAPNVPIGKAFDQAFDKGSWKSFTSTENERIVEFNGSIKAYGKIIKTKIQFKLTGDDTFSLKYVDLDGEALPDLAAVAFLETILETYKP